MPRKGYIRKEMERRLRRAGLHPKDIKLACDFVDNAKRRNDKAEKELEENEKNKAQRQTMPALRQGN